MSAGRDAGYRLLGPRLDYLLHLRPAEWPIMAAHTAVGYLLAVGLAGAAAGTRLACPGGHSSNAMMMSAPSVS